MLMPRMADQPPRVNISGGGDIVVTRAGRLKPTEQALQRYVAILRAVLDTLWSRLFTRFGKPRTSCAISLRVVLSEKDGGKLVERRLVKSPPGWKDAKGRRNNGRSDTDAPAAYNRVVLRGV